MMMNLHIMLKIRSKQSVRRSRMRQIYVVCLIINRIGILKLVIRLHNSKLRFCNIGIRICLRIKICLILLGSSIIFPRMKNRSLHLFRSAWLKCMGYDCLIGRRLCNTVQMFFSHDGIFPCIRFPDI